MEKVSLPKIFKSETPKVYKNKKLNTANFGDFCNTDYQVFLHLVSKIGGVDKYGKYLQSEQLTREHVLTAKEFSETFDISLPHCYGILKQAVDKLMKTDVKVERIELKETWRINVCSMAKYSKKEGYITVKFTDDIMPYLAQVRAKFILYNLKEIGRFRSLYTTRLYELLQEFKETGWMLKSVEQLREVFVVGNKFTAYKDFKRYTFDHACQEINDKHDMRLSFEELKKGRKVVAIKFSFNKVLVHKVVNQKTGIASNIYIKPKSNIQLIGKNNKKSSSKILEGQLAFEPIQSLKNAFDSLLTNLTKVK